MDQIELEYNDDYHEIEIPNLVLRKYDGGDSFKRVVRSGGYSYMRGPDQACITGGGPNWGKVKRNSITFLGNAFLVVAIFRNLVEKEYQLSLKLLEGHGKGKYQSQYGGEIDEYEFKNKEFLRRVQKISTNGRALLFECNDGADYILTQEELSKIANIPDGDGS